MYTACNNKPTHYLKTALIRPQKNHVAQHLGTICKAGIRSCFTITPYCKNYQLLGCIKDAALSLLQTQFAKKPKNPV
jgi:hypothetical protein